MEPIHYNSRKFRIIIAFLAGFYMLVHGTRFDIHRALVSPMFYVVLAISCVAAWLLIEWVHYVTKRLDAIYSWHSKLVERITLQLLLAVILPLLFDLAIFSVYFTIIGTNIFENGFLHADLPFIGVLLVVLSCYYCIHYFVATDKQHKSSQQNEEPRLIENARSSQAGTYLIDLKDGRHVYFQTDKAFCFYRMEKEVYMVTLSGETSALQATIASLREMLYGTEFLQINRAVILNTMVVEGYLPGSKRRTLELVFKVPYRSLLKMFIKDQFVVTEEHISAIKKIFL